ncbi:Ger(x)C family spore germination protein [Paenibacillus sp. DXFW5]|uniref:Ger(X)C family spore germination protein n=1 Tax=Paenibacillus rhizolycopersici TaxID=2780073 RepID=A0ABS2H0H2_9BACL|nr:Ger(x)C family spore germination protein [Paenibacillus rhizolycopersici]MBM6994777.1 Ger(x)C family spore germination protein [Paenibacillus rhizolycopersici]
MQNRLLRYRMPVVSGLLALVLLLAGCSQTRIVDNIKILSVLGVNRDKEEYQAVGLYVDHLRGDKIMPLQGKGENMELLLSEMNMQSPHPIHLGKLRLLVFDRRMAEQGVAHFIHTFCRNPLISTSMIVAISEQPPERLFRNLEGEHREALPYYLIEQNVISDNVPLNNLQIFLFNYYGEGRDPFAPYLSENQDGKIELTGLGIFHDDRLKLVLGAKETLLLKMLKGRGTGGILPVTVSAEPGNRTAAFNVSKGRPVMRLSRDGDASKLMIDLHLVGMLKEPPSGINMRDQEAYRNIVSMLERQIDLGAVKLLNKLRDKGVDPVGVGDFVRAHRRSWDEEVFYKREYTNMRFEIHTQITLKESGIGN